MNAENKTWENLKTQYLRQVEQALSSVKHPRRKEILEDVSSHLDRRFAELKPTEQSWENIQEIITDMGPASDYADLLQAGQPERKNFSPKYLLWAGITAVVIIAVAILLPLAISGKLWKSRIVDKTDFLDKDTFAKETTPDSQQDLINAAVDSAHAWLKLVDDRAYDQSWQQAATSLKNAVSKEQLIQSFDAVRSPLGKVISRSIKSKTYTKQVPGAPDGQYVIIQFETSFENKTSAIETVTPMLDKDGTWRVSGYYIK